MSKPLKRYSLKEKIIQILHNNSITLDGAEDFVSSRDFAIVVDEILEIINNQSVSNTNT